MSQNLIRHSFIFLWRTRLRMIFIADETIEYYPDWLEVQNNRFRLPSIETIPLSIYDPAGKILFMLDIKSNEVKIQSIFLDAFPCDIFDMENIISNQQYRHICYGSGKNSIYIETSIERRCLTPKTFEPVNDDEPIHDDHWKQKTTNFHDKSTKIDHSSEFNLNYLWIVLAVIASIFLLIIFYLHRLIPTSTLRQSTRRPSTRSPLSSSPTRNIFRSRGGGGGMSMKN
ncbi:hypothetical protein BLA29_007089 [Euroglyphus maynei]|uniref:Uncharacterized protein n=1 Tax=Euroglyphus maynei TaxID=6958 RepID=A0A1Y3BH10_EURMA|nr:hypothetical protein BLA29_007089 [Euroglyphus maynei]